jgi:hypothetical protein
LGRRASWSPEAASLQPLLALLPQRASMLVLVGIGIAGRGISAIAPTLLG